MNTGPDVTLGIRMKGLRVLLANSYHMRDEILKLPLDERIQLVEDIWDSIAADQSALPLLPEQAQLLDERLDAYRKSGHPGQLAREAIEDIRKSL